MLTNCTSVGGDQDQCGAMTLDVTTEVAADPTIEAEETKSQSVAVLALMMSIGCLGVLGNGFVIFVIFSFTSMRKKLTNLFIINQSAIDLLVGALLVGNATTKLASGYNIGLKGVAGELYCKLWLSGVLQWGILISSTLNLVAITVERYLMVVHPIVHKTSFTRRRALGVVFAVWTSGLCYQCMGGIPSSVVEDGVCYGYKKFISPAWQKAYGLFTISLKFFMPLIVHPLLYGHMIVVLHRRARLIAAAWMGGNPQLAKIPRTQKNLLKTMAIVTICFFLCWTWNQLAFFFYNLGVPYDQSSDFHLFSIAAVNFNCCINPFIYIAKYEEFKMAVRKLLGLTSTVEPGEASTSNKSTAQSAVIATRT